MIKPERFLPCFFLTVPGKLSPSSGFSLLRPLLLSTPLVFFSKASRKKGLPPRQAKGKFQLNISSHLFLSSAASHHPLHCAPFRQSVIFTHHHGQPSSLATRPCSCFQGGPPFQGYNEKERNNNSPGPHHKRGLQSYN